MSGYHMVGIRPDGSESLFINHGCRELHEFEKLAEEKLATGEYHCIEIRQWTHRVVEKVVDE